MGEALVAPVAAADEVLSLLRLLAPNAAAAIWQRDGDWQCLATAGASDGLPVPQGADAMLMAQADQGMLPIVHGAEMLGCLVWRGMPHELAATLGSLLGGQWLCWRQADGRARSRMVQDALLEISRLASECTGLTQFFSQVYRLLAPLFSVDNFHIVLADDSLGALRFPFYRNRHSGFVPDPLRSYAPDETGQARLAARVLAQPATLSLDASMLRAALADETPTPARWIGEPLVGADGKVAGVVVLQRYADEPAFTAAEQRLFQYAARAIGGALTRMQYQARLEQQVWLRTRELEGANTRLMAEVDERRQAEKTQRVLSDIAGLANSSLSLTAFLAGVHRQLVELMPAHNCQVALYDALSDTIRFPYSVDEYETEPVPHKSGRGLVEQVLHSGLPVLASPRKNRSGAGAGSGAQEPESWLGVPLYSGHDLLGVLSIRSYQAGTSYSYRDQEVLCCVADNVGNALARIRVLEELQRAYAELEERVRERTSALDAVNAQLQFDSMHDALTKLPNRSFFAKTLRRFWEAYASGAGERFAVFFIDLDRFKLVNDTLGHLAGDHLLAEAGNRIRSCMRHKDFMARLGGDEFAVLLSGMEQIEGCEMIAQRMVDEFERPIIIAGREVFTTASLGVVLADKEHHHSAEELLRDADHAMYRTKQQGRHGYTVFNHELRADQADQLAMEAELRRALDESDQLVPYYQPFIDARTGHLAGFEALVRWQHPQRGLIAPSVFLPVAEESGLIMRLDRYMIQAACGQLRQWLDSGRVGEHIALHINLSSANLHDTGLVDWMRALMAQHGLRPGMLHLEITETALIDVPDIAATVMAELHDMGVRLALDDFGTGYSALSYLHRYQFDVLKIDQSFVLDVDRKEESAAIVRAILALADALSLEVVAEGVETLSQLWRLRMMGCEKVQGFLFSHPSLARDIDWGRLATIVQEFAIA
ncbi:EAL domain-containing protein [Paludibacterium sp.]|uniref:bifunctional diguanylate cyclase/phosphodiesterase n=3 Tax=Paludibacterium sp. TaxID=1917523 RepID=UPI0025F88A57|nr:EAL domain-containing protein [Paludibacterium sp.]